MDMKQKKKAKNVALIIIVILFVLQIIISFENLINAIITFNVTNILWFGLPILILLVVVIYMFKDRNSTE